MHRLKEFLHLAAFSLDVPFEPGSHLTDLWQPRMDWHVRSTDNGRGGFWYQPGVRLVSLISISLVNDSSLVTDWSTEVCVGYSQYVLGSGFRNLFFSFFGYVLMHFYWDIRNDRYHIQFILKSPITNVDSWPLQSMLLTAPTGKDVRYKFELEIGKWISPRKIARILMMSLDRLFMYQSSEKI